MLLMVRGAAPVCVTAIVCDGGGQKFRGLILQVKFRLAGTSWTVPFVRVISAVADLLLSAMEVAFKVTDALAGNEAGAVNVVGVPLAVVAGLTVPQPGEQLVAFCASVQVTPPLVGS